MARKRSRSRSKRRNKRGRSSSGSESGRRGSNIKGKPGQAPPPADDDGDITGAEEEDSSMSLQAKVALLEVENATLKTENRELKKKLVELLNKGGSKPFAPAAASSSASKTESAPPAKPVDRRLARAAAAEAESTDRRRGREPAEERKPPPREEPDDGPPDDMKQNAIMLVNNAMEAYNEAVPNNIPNEKRMPLVNQKLERFLENFDGKVQILDLKSGGAIIKDMKMFNMRYQCVFRESGSKLKGITQKRFYYDASGSKPTYSLDYETHESLVTAMPGTPQDGKLGCRDPRTEHLIVLYEEKGGKITRMWLKPDTDKVGKDPYANEDILVRSEEFKAFEAKIAELRGGGAVKHTIFHNYHDTPTVG